MIRQFHDQFIVTPDKEPAVQNAYEASGDPVPVCTLWNREKYAAPVDIRTTIRRSSASYYIYYIEYEVAAHTT